VGGTRPWKGREAKESETPPMKKDVSGSRKLRENRRGCYGRGSKVARCKQRNKDSDDEMRKVGKKTVWFVLAHKGGNRRRTVKRTGHRCKGDEQSGKEGKRGCPGKGKK